MGRPIVRVLSDEDGNDQMADEHEQAAYEQQGPSSESIHGPERGGHANKLRDVEDTRQNKLHIVVLAHGLEQGGRVVDQSVDTHELLEKHDAHANVGSAPASTLEAIRPGHQLQFESA
jgi:hypothetical protein